MRTSGLDRGLTILEAIGDSPVGFTASELADLIRIDRTNIYHYLNTLVARRYIRRDQTGRFHIAHRVLELGAHALQQMPLRGAAHDHVHKLSYETEKTIHLCVLEGQDVLYIDKVEGPKTLPMLSRIGTRVSAHCTASGKILMAHLPPKELDYILDGMVLSRRTSATIVDPEELTKELRICAENGYAVDHGENEEHICCFAAPIFDQTGRAVAAVSLTGLISELVDPAEYIRIRELVLTAAKRISTERGYSAPADAEGAVGDEGNDTAERRKRKKG